MRSHQNLKFIVESIFVLVAKLFESGGGCICYSLPTGAFSSLNSKRGPDIRRVAKGRSVPKRWIVSTESLNRTRFGSLKWSDFAVCVQLQKQTNNVRRIKELMMIATSIEIEGYTKRS